MNYHTPTGPVDRQRHEATLARRARLGLVASARPAPPQQKVTQEPLNLPASTPKPTRIMHEVAHQYGLSVFDLRSARRDNLALDARHHAMWRIRKETSLSLPRIAEIFCRTHAAALRGIREHEVTRSKVRPADDTQPRLKIIQEVAAKHFVSVETIRSMTHEQDVILARHECMYRLRVERLMKSSEIARMLNCDRTSVHYGLKRHKERNGL